MSLFYKIAGKLFKDMIVPVPVRFCKITAYNGVPESKELSFTSVILPNGYQACEATIIQNRLKCNRFHILQQVIHILKNRDI